jgi:hypothetical protein
MLIHSLKAGRARPGRILMGSVALNAVGAITVQRGELATGNQR